MNEFELTFRLRLFTLLIMRLSNIISYTHSMRQQMLMIGHLNSRLNNLSENIWTLLNQIDLLKGQWIGGAQLNPHALGRLKRSVLVTSTGQSTRIEGAKLSD